jgi:arylsulfatase A-like enzyme
MNPRESSTVVDVAVGTRPARWALAAALVAALASGCAPRPPDILLISLDTVRADVFFDEVVAEPGLARWIDDALVYEQGYTPLPFTLPAHVTVLTGLPPRVHGLDSRGERLSRNAKTLAEQFRAAGWATAGVVNVAWLAGSFGFDRGFESYELLPATAHSAPAVAGRALEAAARAGERPSFLFVHFFDAHSDSAADGPAPYTGGAPPESDEESMRRLFCDSAGACATDRLIAANRSGEQLSPDAVALARQLYRAGVRRLLGDLAAFLDAYDESRGLDRTVVAIFSDHGEELAEHGRWLHSRVFEETSRVPIVLRDGRKPVAERRSVPVGLEELFSTLSGIVGVEDSLLGGRDLLSRRMEASSSVPVFVQDKLFRGRSAVRVGDWKLHRDLRTDTTHLFDLRSDPRELVDLAAVEVSRVEELTSVLDRRIQLERRLAARFEPERRSRSGGAEEERSLRALGYL